ncbi:7468_t:CDS:2, partial [Cetraspora pellucida]
IDGNPVDLFEFNKGKLLPMPQSPINKEAVVHEISRQLGNWNMYTHQNGIITTSQGGFDFDISGRRTIRAPDIAFISKNIYRSLDRQQQWTFKGQPFTPTFVLEVAIVRENYQEFNDLDQKFREIYFATSSSVDLGWLVDSKNKQIYIYRQRVSGVVYRTSHGWNNVNGDYNFIGQESSESSSENDEIIDCLKCNATFSNDYDFMKHYENSHAQKRYLLKIPTQNLAAENEDCLARPGKANENEIPKSMNEIFTGENVKWGGKRIPDPILTYAVNNRIYKEVKSSKEMKNNNEKERNNLFHHLEVENTRHITHM